MVARHRGQGHAGQDGQQDGVTWVCMVWLSRNTRLGSRSSRARRIWTRSSCASPRVRAKRSWYDTLLLGGCEVQIGHLALADRLHAVVRHHPYDLDRRIRPIHEAEHLADRALPRPEASGQRLVHHRHSRRVRGVRGQEAPALEDGHAQGLEVLRGDRGVLEGEAAVVGGSVPGHVELALVEVDGERQTEGGGHGHDPGERADALLGPLVELPGPFPGVAQHARVGGHDGEALGAEAHLGALGDQEAPPHEPGRHQEDEGHGHLGGHERVPEGEAPAPGFPGRRLAPQLGHEVGPRGAERRGQAGQEAGQERGRESEGEHAQRRAAGRRRAGPARAAAAPSGTAWWPRPGRRRPGRPGARGRRSPPGAGAPPARGWPPPPCGCRSRDGAQRHARAAARPRSRRR